MMPVGEVPAVCDGVHAIIRMYVRVSPRERRWMRRSVRGFLPWSLHQRRRVSVDP